MRPTPDEVIAGARAILKQEVAPLLPPAAQVQLKRVMAVLRDARWNEAGFDLLRENTAFARLAQDGAARLDRDFRFRLGDASSFGWDGQVLELRPLRDEPGYTRMFLFVDPNAAGVVRRVIVQDHAGNLNRFDFQRTEFNRAIAAERFAFTPPTGARRI